MDQLDRHCCGESLGWLGLQELDGRLDLDRQRGELVGTRANHIDEIIGVLGEDGLHGESAELRAPHSVQGFCVALDRRFEVVEAARQSRFVGDPGGIVTEPADVVRKCASGLHEGVDVL
ncbi:hypothetical protein [Agromyces sp. Marseille-P2726]|uniref:hypothetical protein n=1 Tax=Agromyces sp. Marseille-P2726 TaxID=2709132 RepID=UPI00156F36FC|nr:hypothetical protein [Agromyces sp. Marseille-P2726]